jgi:hypothetical protein
MQPADDAPDSRAKELLRSLHADPQLEAWAKRLQAQADTFLKTRKPDPLDGFLCNHLR